tara:strand:- start:80 stop:622 length:543 start_codon:yes stop_codon:yes gene_type:complete
MGAPFKFKTMEEFKDIKGYEGLYQVSNLGRVKSLARKSIAGLNLKEKIRVGVVSNKGYVMVDLCKEGKRKGKTIHQLVAVAFLDHKPCGHRLVVNHIDFDKANNNVNNLEIVTQRENSNRKHIKSSSKYTGVSWSKVANKWIAQIRINGEGKYLGYFKCEIAASMAYEIALNNFNKSQLV